jgi:cytochrome P450
MIPLVTKRFSLLGDVKEYVTSPIDYLAKKTKEYGDTFRFRIAGRYITFTGDPELIKEILQTKNKAFRKSKSYRKLELLLGKALFTSEGDYWLKQRRLIQPAFSNAKLAHYTTQIDKTCEDKFSQLNTSQPVNIKDVFIDLTLEIITQCLLGISSKDETKKVNKHLPRALSYMLNRITSPLAPPLWFPIKSNNNFKADVKELNNIISELIQRKKQDLGQDLLSSLIEIEDEDTGEKMSNQQLIDETLTIFLAGHETTAITLTWFIYSLLKHPTYLDLVFEECKEKPFHELMGNSMLKACLNETMRLYSPIWVLGREPIQDLTINSYHLRQKEGVIFSPYLIHRDERFWKNPKQFYPERFINNEYNEEHFIPFGGGPRLCIGKHFSILEMVIIIQKMMTKLGKPFIQNLPKEEFEYSLTLRPKQKIEVRFDA